MTIKNITLSLVATSLLTTAGFATVVQPTLTKTKTNNGMEQGVVSSAQTFAIEKANLGQITANSANALVFQVQMNKSAVLSAKDPSVQITIPKLSSTAQLSKLALYDLNVTNGAISKKVANKPTVAKNDTLVFDTNTTMVAGQYYVLADNNTSARSNYSDLTADNLEYTIPKDSKSVQATVQIVSNNSVVDSGHGAIARGVKQFTYSVSQPATAQIDSANSFFSFAGNVNGYNSQSDTKDKISANFTNNSDVKYGYKTAKLDYVISADQNLTGLITATDKNGNVVKFKNNDLNVSVSNATTNAFTTKFNDISTAKGVIPVTHFTTSAWVTVGNPAKRIQIANAQNAGRWTIYGYSAQIPNVSATSYTSTVLKFTNRSKLTKNIYFTLIDPNGTKVTFSSKSNPSIAVLKPYATSTYKASTLEKVAKTINPNFNDKTSFSVEVTIASNPNNVYGMASFKNKSLGQFKMLPVYTNGLRY